MCIANHPHSTATTGAMFKKIEEVEIPPDDPFLYDMTGRKHFAEQLFNIVENSPTPLVLCINAKWGEGKTTFLKMFGQYLELNDFPTIYFDSWKNDFVDKPEIAFFGEIWFKAKDLKLLDSEKSPDGVKIFFNVASAILKYHINKHLGDGTTELLANLGKGLSIEQQDIEKEFEAYLSRKKQLEDCRNALEAIASYIGKSKRSNSPRPLVFIIDELDRCRPSFAVEILETTKHLFNARNVIFIIAVNRHQLGTTIKALYGSGDDVDGYLRKFIDLDITMQPPINGKEYTTHLMNKYSISEEIQSRQTNAMHLYYDSLEGLIDLLTSLFEFFEFSMRDQEYYATLFSMIIKVNQEKTTDYLGLLAFFLALKLKNPVLYLEVFENRKSCRALWKEIFSEKHFFIRNDGKKNSVDHLHKTLEALLERCGAEDILLDFHGEQHNNANKSIVISIVNQITDSIPANKEIDDFVHGYLKDCHLNQIIRKIEIALPILTLNELK